MTGKVRGALALREGERFRCRARLATILARKLWSSPTLLLKDVTQVSTGIYLTDHMWILAGRWSAILQQNDVFEFDARVSIYFKTDNSRKKRSASRRDWKLGYPSKVVIITRGDRRARSA